jgi:hypothetical protein
MHKIGGLWGGENTAALIGQMILLKNWAIFPDLPVFVCNVFCQDINFEILTFNVYSQRN